MFIDKGGDKKGTVRGGEKMSRRINLRRFDKRMRKKHNDAVGMMAYPENLNRALKIEELTKEKILWGPKKFPQLKKNGKETGDLLLVWSSSPWEWEILVLELTVSNCNPLAKYFPRLEMSYKYFKAHWEEWFKTIGLNLPEDYSLWLRTVAVSYGGKCFWEEPYKCEKRSIIFQKIGARK
ncbi:MAG: hypothetical protein WC507_02290 [Candidatus Paceibacterota bacterium]